MNEPRPVVTFVDLTKHARVLGTRDFIDYDPSDPMQLALQALTLQPPAIPTPNGQRVPAVLQATHLVGKVLVCVWVASWWNPEPEPTDDP